MSNVTIGVWPVNELGDILLQSGEGSTSVYGSISQDSIPVDSKTGKVSVKMPANTVVAVTSSEGIQTGISGGKQGVLALRPTLIAGDFGASFNELNDLFGLNFSSPSAVTGIVQAKGNISCPSGSALLEYNSATKSARVTLNGESTGEWVAISDGIYRLPSGSTGNYLRISVIKRLLPTVNATENLTSSTRYWSRPRGSWKYQLSFASKEQIKWLPTNGIGGATSKDIAGSIDTIKSQGAQIQFMCVSGNDAVTGGMSVAESVEQTLKNADAILQSGVPLILQPIPPRYGRSATGANLAFTGEYTLQRQGNLVSCNRGCVAGSYKRTGMYVAEIPFATNPVDPQGAGWNGETEDGKHCSGGLAHRIAASNWQIASTMFNGHSYTGNVGIGDYYNSLYNVGGNLLPSGQASFLGTGGTKNTTITNTPSWLAQTVFQANSYCISYATANVTISIASPGVVTSSSHGLRAGNPVVFSTTGVLPTGITAGTVYYVANVPAVTDNTFSVASTPTGAAINTSGTQSGTHTVTNQLGNLYFTVTGGTTGTSFVTGTDDAVKDGTVTWKFLASGCTGGLADGWVASMEGTADITCHIVTSPDGSREQEFTVRNATVDGNVFRASPSAPDMSNIQVGDVLAWEYDVSISNPKDCYGLFSDVQITGGSPVVWDNQSMTNIQQGMSWTEGRLALEPMAFPVGATYAQPRTHVQSKKNGNFRVKYKFPTLRKVF